MVLGKLLVLSILNMDAGLRDGVMRIKERSSPLNYNSKVNQDLNSQIDRSLNFD